MVVGKSVKRVDAIDKVTGKAKYTDDLADKSALIVKIYHSTIAHGMVKSVDTSAAEKIPGVDREFGIHYPFVGPRRGGIAGFKAMSWNPNEAYKEQLYVAKLNYVEKDSRSTRFGSQSTTQFANSALSDINHVRTLLRIRRDLEALAENFQFEFNDTTTWGQMEYSVNSYLQGWVANRACQSASGSVYASKYDQQQRVVRVKAELVFTGVIERVLIDLVVNR